MIPGGSGSNGEPPLLAPLFTGAVTPVPALGTDEVPDADDVSEADDVPEEDVVPEGDRLVEGGDVQAASSRSTTIKNPSRRMGDLFSRCAPSVARDAGGWEDCGIWPSEMDLMARLASLRLVERWGGWAREPFTARSTRHVSVYGLGPSREG